MPLSRHSAAIICGLITAMATARSQGSAPVRQGTEALGDIVGVWQSDTTNGASALSRCVWTPEHVAVLCDQSITLPTGTQRALNLFTFDSATNKYAFYVLTQPGKPMQPVPLSIKDHVWIYGGLTAGPDGRTSRTINDFSTPGSYKWRQESMAKGGAWTVGAHGHSRRVK
jgi:hypothetical protein